MPEPKEDSCLADIIQNVAKMSEKIKSLEEEISHLKNDNHKLHQLVEKANLSNTDHHENPIIHINPPTHTDTISTHNSFQALKDECDDIISDVPGEKGPNDRTSSPEPQKNNIVRGPAEMRVHTTPSSFTNARRTSLPLSLNNIMLT